jgi:hypothetical protein
MLIHKPNIQIKPFENTKTPTIRSVQGKQKPQAPSSKGFNNYFQSLSNINKAFISFAMNNKNKCKLENIDNFRELVNKGELESYLQNLDEETLRKVATSPAFIRNSIIITKEKINEEIEKLQNKKKSLTQGEKQKLLELKIASNFFALQDLPVLDINNPLISSIEFAGKKLYAKKPPKEEIEQLIEDYAQAHSVTCGFVAGVQQVIGGVAAVVAGAAASANPAGALTGPAAAGAAYSSITSFPVDTGILSTLTTTMINDICDQYGVEDKIAKGLFISTALINATWKGTVIAKIITNNIPIVGPIANVGTTYFLTKDIGYQCVKDIEKDRMNVKSQSLLSIGRVASTLGAQFIAENSSKVVTQNFKKLSELIDKSKDIINPELFKTINTFREFLQDSAITDFSKSVLSGTLSDLCQSSLEEASLPDLKASLRVGFISTSCAQLFDNSIVKNKEWYLEHKDEFIKQQEHAKEFYGKYFDAWNQQIQREIIRLQQAIGPSEREKILEDFDELMGKIIESANQSNDFKEIQEEKDSLFES